MSATPESGHQAAGLRNLDRLIYARDQRRGGAQKKLSDLLRVPERFAPLGVITLRCVMAVTKEYICAGLVMLLVATWPLTPSGFAQSAPDKPTTPAPSGSQKDAPPIGGATIPRDMRTNATKDVPMGDGKPKSSAPAGPSEKRSK